MCVGNEGEHSMLRGVWRKALTILLASSYPWMLCAQEADPFSIRVESNLVLVRAAVVNKAAELSSIRYIRCYEALQNKFRSLVPFPSQPYLPGDCSDWMIYDLSSHDFHVFEDGIEQSIQSVLIEPEPGMTARDNMGRHDEWSNTPQGKWSTTDVHDFAAETLHLYTIAYVPSKLAEGSCHHLRITVNRAKAIVFAPDQYCYTPHPATDPLLGTHFGKQLEGDLKSDEKPKIPLLAQATFMYVDAHAARVDVVMEFPWDHLKYGCAMNGDVEANIGILGAVYTGERLIRRFSDSAFGGIAWGPHIGTPDDCAANPARLPSRYETQLNLVPGKYDLRVVLSDGAKFGRADVPLKIDDFDGQQLAVSSVALLKRFRNASAAAQEAAHVNLAPDYVPLVSQDRQITPTADATFSRKQLVAAYFEVYDHLLAQQPSLKVQAHVRIVSVQTGAAKTFDWFDAAEFRRAETTTLAIAKAFPVNDLPKGEYRLEVQASDSAGRSTPWRAANLTLK